MLVIVVDYESKFNFSAQPNAEQGNISSRNPASSSTVFDYTYKDENFERGKAAKIFDAVNRGMNETRG